MATSASKQKRLAEKAAKVSARANGQSSTGKSSPALRVDRSAAGVLVSDVKGRDIKIDSYTLSFHGRLLIENAEIALNYGQRYGLLGENGSGKVRVIGPIQAYQTQERVVHFLAIDRRARYRDSRPYRYIPC